MMFFKVSLLLMILGANAPAFGVQTETNCVDSAQILKEENGPKFKEFLVWLKSQSSSLNEIDQGHFVSTVLPELDQVYIADINNDGKEEYVVVWAEGSGAYLVMYVFSRLKDKFHYEKRLTDFIGSNIAHDVRPYKNALTYEEELFTRVCGKTYISVKQEIKHPLPSRISYIWQEGKIIPACDERWIPYNRKIFQQFYQEESYAKADKFMRSIAQRCGNKIEAHERLWIKNDLALTQFHMGNYKGCLTTLKEMEKDPLLQIMQKLKNAVISNEYLCKSNKGDDKVDYSWLVSDIVRYNDDVVTTPQFDNLLTLVVPDFEKPADSLFKTVKNDLSNPTLDYNDEVGGDGKRYFFLYGCTKEDSRENHCSMFWADIQKKIGIVAISALPDDADTAMGDCSFVIGSRQVTANLIPAEFWDVLFHWGPLEAWNYHDRKECIAFIGKEGKIEPIFVPKL